MAASGRGGARRGSAQALCSRREEQFSCHRTVSARVGVRALPERPVGAGRRWPSGGDVGGLERGQRVERTDRKSTGRNDDEHHQHEDPEYLPTDQLEHDDPVGTHRGGTSALRDRVRDRARCPQSGTGKRSRRDRSALGARSRRTAAQAPGQGESGSAATQAQSLEVGAAASERRGQSQRKTRAGRARRTLVRTRGGDGGEGEPCGSRRGRRGCGARGWGSNGPPGSAFEPPSSSEESGVSEVLIDSS